MDLMLEDIGDTSNIKFKIEDAKRITSFICNSDKVVNLIKKHTNGRDLLRFGINRFVTIFIALKNIVWS